MQKIIPHLWFDKEALEAADLYTSTFPDSTILSTTTLQNTPSGSTEVVSFDLWGQQYQAISAGPLFEFNPSISFHVKCSSKEQVDEFWNRLSPGGQVLIELGAYPFSERYGWLNDKYGLSWQLIYAPQDASQQRITPVFMFAGNRYGWAEQAITFWSSVFQPAHMISLDHDASDEKPERNGKVRYAAFSLFGQEFGAMDSPGEHPFGFNEAISFMVNCDSQVEIDQYWNKLSHVREAEQCGWLKDKFGISWQVLPVQLAEMLGGNDRDRINRVTQAFLSMKKLDIARLMEAYSGEFAGKPASIGDLPQSG